MYYISLYVYIAIRYFNNNNVHYFILIISNISIVQTIMCTRLIIFHNDDKMIQPNNFMTELPVEGIILLFIPRSFNVYRWLLFTNLLQLFIMLLFIIDIY